MNIITSARQNWVATIAIFAFFILLIILDPLNCRKPVNGKATRDTVQTVKHDTTFMQVNQQVPVYVPIQTGSQAPIVIPPNYQASTIPSELLAQYKELLNRHLSTNTYKDSVQLKDSAGNRLGVFNLTDVISENEIKSRNASYSLNIPKITTTVTNTITVTQPYKAKFQVLVGLGLTGNQTSYLNGGYIGLGFKNKKDQIFLGNIGAMKAIGGTLVPQFGVSTYIPIKLGKK